MDRVGRGILPANLKSSIQRDQGDVEIDGGKQVL
jgi:hypothetical protein